MNELMMCIYISLHYFKETCSWVDRWCWPGSCPDDFTSSCSCMQGFRTV